MSDSNEMRPGMRVVVYVLAIDVALAIVALGVLCIATLRYVR